MSSEPSEQTVPEQKRSGADQARPETTALDILHAAKVAKSGFCVQGGQSLEVSSSSSRRLLHQKGRFSPGAARALKAIKVDCLERRWETAVQRRSRRTGLGALAALGGSRSTRRRSAVGDRAKISRFPASGWPGLGEQACRQATLFETAIVDPRPFYASPERMRLSTGYEQMVLKRNKRRQAVRSRQRRFDARSARRAGGSLRDSRNPSAGL